MTKSEKIFLTIVIIATVILTIDITVGKKRKWFPYDKKRNWNPFHKKAGRRKYAAAPVVEHFDYNFDRWNADDDDNTALPVLDDSAGDDDDQQPIINITDGGSYGDGGGGSSGGGSDGGGGLWAQPQTTSPPYAPAIPGVTRRFAGTPMTLANLPLLPDIIGNIAAYSGPSLGSVGSGDSASRRYSGSSISRRRGRF